ncbi:MAG: suppressor of fused domain protein [Planctomycetota bacterium]
MTAVPPPDESLQQWFESVWADREERVYRELFTDLGGGIHPATAAHYARFKHDAPHPGFLHHGVFACPPHGDRSHWTYVTSGLSNPWNLQQPGRDPQGHSGTGFELVLCTKDRADWAVELLHHLMAWQLLIATGTIEGQPLGPDQRVPLGGPMDGTPGCPLTWVMVEAPESEHMPSSFELASGKVDWLLLVGITEAEVGFARMQSQPALLERLHAAELWPVTDPRRESIE